MKKRMTALLLCAAMGLNMALPAFAQDERLPAEPSETVLFEEFPETAPEGEENADVKSTAPAQDSSPAPEPETETEITAEEETTAENAERGSGQTGNDAEGRLPQPDAPAAAAENEIMPISERASGIFGANGSSEYNWNGSNLRWSLSTDGVLTISGTGDMGDMWSTAQSKIRPWENYLNDIREIVIQNGVTDIGKGAFHDCKNLQKVTIPSTVTWIVCFSFQNCTSLKSISIPSSVRGLGHYVFQNCSSLQEISIPGSVRTFGVDDFDGTPWQQAQGDFCVVNGILLACQKQTADVAIPSGVKEIGGNAFTHNEYARTVTIPDTVTAIDESAFYRAPVTAINVSPANSAYSSADGVLYNKQKTRLLQYPAMRSGTCTIPEGVTEIADEAFMYSNVTRVSIPKTVTKIGYYTFGYSTIEEVAVPGSVRTLEKWGTFYMCRNLKSVILGEGVTAITGGSIFSGCPQLTSIVLPASLESISSNNFAYCDKLSNIVIKNPQCGIPADQYAFGPGYKGISISGMEGSTAQAYAQKYGFAFRPIVIRQEGNTLRGVAAETTASDLQAFFCSETPLEITNQTGAYIGTGSRVRLNGQDLTVVVPCDVDGDGQVGLTDVVQTRKAMVNILKLDGVYLQAAQPSGTEDGRPGLSDIIYIRKVFSKIL